MAITPWPKNIHVVAGATYCYQLTRVYNAQVIALSGAGTGTWQIQVGSKLTAALPRSATPAQVQTALRAINSIGPNGVTVSGTAGVSYRLDWGGSLYTTLQARVQVVGTTDVDGQVTRVPFDWTGWTASWRVAFNDATGQPSTDDLVTLTGTATANGQIVIGYVEPTVEGDALPTPVPANGTLAILLTTAFTSTLPDLFDANPIHRGASHVLMLHRGLVTNAILDGRFSVTREP